MKPEEEKIFGAFSECPLVTLEGAPTYEYMTNLNVYLLHDALPIYVAK